MNIRINIDLKTNDERLENQTFSASISISMCAGPITRQPFPPFTPTNSFGHIRMIFLTIPILESQSVHDRPCTITVHILSTEGIPTHAAKRNHIKSFARDFIIFLSIPGSVNSERQKQWKTQSGHVPNKITETAVKWLSCGFARCDAVQ